MFDDTVVAAGDNSVGQCDISDWTDIIQVDASWQWMVGLTSAGTTVAMGRNYKWQCDIGGWMLK
jgi:hypothetical protein